MPEESTAPLPAPTPGVPTVSAAATPTTADALTPITDFYVKHCYVLLGGVLVGNVVGATFLYFIGGENGLLYATTLTLASWGLISALWSNVEDKQKVPLAKRLVTIGVCLAIPVGQAAATFVPKRPDVVTTAEQALLDDSVAIVRTNEYRNTDAIRNFALPPLLKLAKAHPGNANILFPLGIAQFETRQFDAAITTFSTLVDKDPRNFKNHYHLGISYKRQADAYEREFEEKKIDDAAGKVESHRRKAAASLREAVSRYEAVFEAERYYWWRLKRNIGWLDYQVSRRCADRPLCESAKAAHMHAINGDATHAGNPDYILAYRNLGRIHERLGDLADAERILRDGLGRHQTMIERRDLDAWKTENRYIYTTLAELLHSGKRPNEALAVLLAAVRVFPLPVFDRDRLDEPVRTQLLLAARQTTVSVNAPPATGEHLVERE